MPICAPILLGEARQARQVSLAMAITIDANRQITRTTSEAAQSFGIGRS
jgi:hypothetical protein